MEMTWLVPWRQGNTDMKVPCSVHRMQLVAFLYAVRLTVLFLMPHYHT
jgi:hypothetical protein